MTTTKQNIIDKILSIMMWAGLIIACISIAYWIIWVIPFINSNITGGIITKIITQGGVVIGLFIIIITSMLGKLYGSPVPKT